MIERCKESKRKFLHALQVSPEVRVVLTTKAQLADVVKFCCDPGEYSIFGIDITYTVWQWPLLCCHCNLQALDASWQGLWETPKLSWSHDDTHWRRSSSISLLCELFKGAWRDIKNILFVGCDCQKSIVNGLSSELSIAQFLACTIHVQDNIKRKMSSLYIPEEVQAEILVEIFGEWSNKGLIDSKTAEKLDARLMSLQSSWVNKDIKATRKETALFYSFYYNNCPESMHSCLKKEERSKSWKILEVLVHWILRHLGEVHWKVPPICPWGYCWKLSI